MSGNGRTLTLTSPIPVQDVVWVPIIRPFWRDDEQDRIPTEQQERAS